MSKGIRRSLQPSLLASKRFIVSACAAIAMVMGAMSVGASMFEHKEPSDDRQRAEASAIFDPNTHSDQNDASAAKAQKEATSQLKIQKPISAEQQISLDLKARDALSTVPTVINALNLLKEALQPPLLPSKLQLKLETVPILPDIIPENILPKSPVSVENPVVPDPSPPPMPTPEPPIEIPTQPADTLSSQSTSLNGTE